MWMWALKGHGAFEHVLALACFWGIPKAVAIPSTLHEPKDLQHAASTACKHIEFTEDSPACLTHGLQLDIHHCPRKCS